MLKIRETLWSFVGYTMPSFLALAHCNIAIGLMGTF
jgi:hypothetical protein